MSRPRSHTRSSPSEARILDAAERLLRIHPFHAITVEQILQESGLSRGNFYFYFSSKYDVLAALMWRVYNDLFATVNPWFEDDGSDPIGALRKSVAAGATAWEVNGKVAGALLESVGSNQQLTELWDQLVERAVESISTKIDDERARGAAPPGAESRVLAAVVTRGVQRILHLGLRGTHPELPSLSVAEDGAFAFWVAAVYGPVDFRAR
jgi:TetR/AcrR family transcriptional regulator, ethionamide resistance regulator